MCVGKDSNLRSPKGDRFTVCCNWPLYHRRMIQLQITTEKNLLHSQSGRNNPRHNYPDFDSNLSTRKVKSSILLS